MDSDHLNFCHSVLGPGSLYPICRTLAKMEKVTRIDLTDTWLDDHVISDFRILFKENTLIKELKIGRNKLTSACAESLCDILSADVRMESIDLSRNLFDDAAAPYFSELLMNSLKLAQLNLSNNYLTVKSIADLTKGISQSANLKELDLSWNCLVGKGWRAFCKTIGDNKTLKILNLAATGIGPKEGCPELAQMIKSNKCLKSLDLSHNRITAIGAVQFGKGFLANTTLKHLKLSRNPLQSAGCYAVLAAILRNANTGLCTLDFGDINTNQQFSDLLDSARKKVPKLTVNFASDRLIKQTRCLPERMWTASSQASISQTLLTVSKSTRVSLVDLMRPLDNVGDGYVTRRDFIMQLKKTNMQLTEEEMKRLLTELDPKNLDEIEYRSVSLSPMAIPTPMSSSSGMGDSIMLSMEKLKSSGL